MKLAEMTIKEVNDYYNHCESDCLNCVCYGGCGCVLDYIPYLRYVTLENASKELGFEITEKTTIKELFLNLLERKEHDPEETENYEPDFDEDDNPLARMLHERGMKN